MNKEEVLFCKHMQDLAKSSYLKNIPVFSDFLSMNELSLLYSLESKLSGVRVETYGGYEFAERQMAKFVSDALFYDCSYPIKMLKIAPAHKKFAEALSHRDYLGSILGLGLERNVLGDLVLKDQSCYVYCHERIAEFLLSELTKVKHTFVTVSECRDDMEVQLELKEVRGIVSSLRVDAVIAMVYQLSRSGVIPLFDN